MVTALNMATPRRQFRSTLAATAWSVSGFGMLVLGAWLVYTTAGEVHYLLRPLPPTPPEVSRDIVINNAYDAAGRRASFRILLFTDEFRWRINSFDALDAEPQRPQFTPEMKTLLNDAKEIICVGASSEEIPSGVSFAAGRSAEERRAARRAERIALWVREVLEKPIPVRKLNVGHHAPTKDRPQDTSDQRRVVIILVLDYDDRTNLDQALRAAMARESIRAPIFEALLTRYSLAAGHAFTWVP
jgi:hypothetical protein